MKLSLKNFTKKKAAAFGLAFGVAAGAGGIAAAYFTTTGNGTGSTTTGSSTPFTVVQLSKSGTLYPGTTTATVTFTIKNAGAGNQKVSAATPSVATVGGDITSGGSAVTGCLSKWYQVTDGLVVATLAPGTSTTDAVTVNMTNGTGPTGSTQNACQGKLPVIHLHVTS